MKQKKHSGTSGSSTTASHDKWEVLFSQINEMAIQALGEKEWATIVDNADKQISQVGDLVPTNRHQLAILAAGLYVGAVYGKAMNQCPPTETK